MAEKRRKKSIAGEKIRVLRKENVPEKQAVAEALSMERAGRLRKGGKYVRVHKRRSGRRK